MSTSQLLRAAPPLASTRSPAGRAATALLGYAAVRSVGLLLIAADARDRHQSFVRVLVDWDSNWFLIVARHGYDGGAPATNFFHTQLSDLAFFPLYPLAVRVLHTVAPLSWQLAALAVAWAASLAAAWGVFKVGELLYGRRVGTLAAVLWGLLPVSVVSQLAYSESLFTALAAWSLYAVLRRRWIWAGVLCALAGLTRAQGVALVAGVGLAALAALVGAARRGELRAQWRVLPGALLAPLGWGGYVLWVGARVHEPVTGYFRIQADWNSRFDGGVWTWHWLSGMLGDPRPVPLTYVVMAAMLIAAMLLLVVSGLHRQPVALLVFSAVLVLIAWGDAGFPMCRGRLLLPAFPLLFPPAAAMARLRGRASLLLLLAAGTALSALLGSYLLFVWPQYL